MPDAALRVLLLSDRIPPENRGGAGAVVWRLAVALHDAGHIVHVGAATPQPTFEHRREGIATTHIHSRYPERWRAWLSLYNPQTARTLRHLYESFRPDVVNAHNIHADLSYHALTLSRQMGIATVFSSHDVMPFAYTKLSHFIDPAVCGVHSPADYRLPPGYNLRTARFRYNPLRNRIIRRILTRDALVRTVPSDELGRAHIANGLPPFTTVHNGLNPVEMRTSTAAVVALRQRFGLEGRRVILFAGRLTAAKGTNQLLKAMAQVVKSVPDVALLVLTAGDVNAQIPEKYATLREHHVVGGGWLQGEELAAAYHLADIVTSPSVIFDTFPTVNLEAMAAARPVVATCYGGSREAVIDGETGYIINPYDTVTFTDRLIALLTDDTLRARMGAAGLAHLQARFSMQHQVDAMMACYQEAMSRNI